MGSRSPVMLIRTSTWLKCLLAVLPLVAINWLAFLCAGAVAFADSIDPDRALALLRMAERVCYLTCLPLGASCDPQYDSKKLALLAVPNTVLISLFVALAWQRFWSGSNSPRSRA